MLRVIEKFDRRKDAFFPIEVRYVARDDAWLSPFHDEPCMSIATHAAADEDYEYFYSEFEPLYLAAGGRPHWGKLHSLGRDSLAERYGQFKNFVEVRKSIDPYGKFLNSHLAKLFGERFDG